MEKETLVNLIQVLDGWKYGKKPIGYVIDHIEALSTTTNEGAKTAYDVLSKYLESCYLTHGEKLSDKYKPYLLKAMQEYATLPQSDGQSDIEIVRQAITKYPDKAKEYREGKVGLIGIFLGEVMKLSKGNADPKLFNELIKNELDKSLPQSDGQRYSEEEMERAFKVGQSHGLTYKGNNFKRFIQSLPQEPKQDGQRYGEEDIRKAIHLYLAYPQNIFLKVEKVLPHILQSLQSKEQEPKGSEGEQGARLYKGKRIFP